MCKTRVCVGRTINLAKAPKVEKKTSLLVYEKDCATPPPSPCYTLPPIKRCSGAKIKVCTGAQLKKMCPPKICSCQPKPPPPSWGKRLCRLLGFGIKGAIAAGLVYWTYDQGLWSDSEASEEFYMNACNTFLPVFCPPVERKWKMRRSCQIEQTFRPPEEKYHGFKECGKPPIDTERFAYHVKKTWNKVVTCVFSGVTDFPHNIICFYHRMTSPKDEDDDTAKSSNK